MGGGPRESPLAEGIATEVWAENGGALGLGGVGGDEDFGDASTAIEGDSAEESRAIGWEAISGGHVEALEDLGDDGEFVEIFDLIGAVEAWDDESKGEAVEEGERLAVHFEGDDDFAVGGVVDIESLDEVWGLGEVRESRPLATTCLAAGWRASFG